ncbi:MAG: hypothetical protein JNM36_15635 [Chitinophagales bacterium]|nr:hypothetical protein [Chitinophagales bacterium]HNI45217.1 hypothetical protein [Chitinophagales bacterium]
MDFQNFQQFSLDCDQQATIIGGTKLTFPAISLPAQVATIVHSAATNAPALFFPIIEEPPLPPIID